MSRGREGADGARAAGGFQAAALEAVTALDARSFEAVLKEAQVELGAQGVLQRFIAPLAQTIGREWRDGFLTAAHEHFATAIIRSYLTQAARPFGAMRNSPVLVVVTPAGQLHDLGALLASR